MGNNVDLVKMLGLPKKLMCPECNKVSDSYFDDYDIDCGEPNPSPGQWTLRCYCQKCEYEWNYTFTVIINAIKEDIK